MHCQENGGAVPLEEVVSLSSSSRGAAGGEVGIQVGGRQANKNP